MRDYGKVSPIFWTGETGKRLRKAGRDAQLVALYLITCPSSNMIGLYYLPLPTLCHETGLTTEGASKALERVSEGGFGYYDADSELVWVPEMARYQLGDSLTPKDNRWKGVIREAENYRKSKFYENFHKRYRTAYQLPDPSPLEAPWKPRARTGARTGFFSGIRRREEDEAIQDETGSKASRTRPAF